MTVACCLRCGTLLAWRHLPGDSRPREVCPSCGWVHYRAPKLGAGVWIEQNGQLLLIRRADPPWQGYWNLPAGYVEVDEPPDQAAAREAQEETGLEVRIVRLVDALFFDDDPRGNGVLLLYAAEVVGGVLRGSAEGEELAFFPPDAIPDRLAGGAHDRAIRLWQRTKRSPH